jgi:hypothetical protein
MIAKVLAAAWVITLALFLGAGLAHESEKQFLVGKKEPMMECLKNYNGFYWCYDNILLGGT